MPIAPVQLTSRRKLFGRVLGLLALLVMGFLAFDYTTYYHKLDSRMVVVSDLGGRAGSLLDWPLGREIRITFDRPLSAPELERLAVLNDLSSRHWVGVMFKCDLSDAERVHIRSVLRGCHVVHSPPEDAPK